MMKKTVLCVVFVMGGIFSLCSSVFSNPLVTVKAETGSSQIFVNGKPFILKAPVTMKDGAHIVRLKKELFTSLGVKYLEQGSNPILVQLTHGGNKVVLEIKKGQKEIKVKSGGSTVKVNPMPTLEYPHVFVPLEPLYELLGFSVSGAPQKVTQKPKTEMKKTVPVKEKETSKMPETAVTQPETQTDVTAEPVTPEKMPVSVIEEAQVEPATETPVETQTAITQTPEETKPAVSPALPAKQEKFSVSFGYSVFAPEYVKFSNSGLEGRLSYALSKKSDIRFEISYADHNWTSVYPTTGQDAEFHAALWTANLTYALPFLNHSQTNPLNALYLTGGYAGISLNYEPNTALGLSSRKQNFSGANVGVGAKFWNVFTAEYRFYIFPKKTLDFRSIESSSAEQFTFSLTPLSF